MKKILVTGGAGYIGSCLVPKLLSNNYSVKVLDRFFFGKDKLSAHPNLELVQDDSRKKAPALFDDIDAVIDLVAISNDPSGELFQNSTMEINHLSRAHTAKIAKEKGVKKYILPSSCSIYGFQEKNIKVTEESKTNPLTTYAKANEKAEHDVLKLADSDFTVTVMRQATIFGLSPRMRFDLAINGMVCGAVATGKIPLLRDGTQYRPMLHIQDTTDVMLLLLESDPQKTNKQIFNVGSDENNYQLLPLAQEVQANLPVKVDIEWYGDPDHRSYQANFDKIEKTLGWHAKRRARHGVLEIYEQLQKGLLTKTTQTITLEWYKTMVKWDQHFNQKDFSISKHQNDAEIMEWHKRIQDTKMYGGLIDIS